MKNKNFYILLYFTVLIVVLSTGCTTRKKLTYFNKVDSDTAQYINQMKKFTSEFRVVKGDEVVITVSALDPKAVVGFNLPFVSYSAPSSDQIYATPTLQPYVVDGDGFIDFPELGKLHIAGMSRHELISFISEKVEKYVSNPIVSVRFLNKAVSVMGEVKNPGYIPMLNERMSVLDVLAAAGDLTPYGRRDNVLLAREMDGKIEFVRINLNDASVFLSPYFYIQQNDVIYVEPNAVKSISSQNLPLYLSTLTSLSSVVALIFSIYQSGKN